jgi:hypothetical protein
VCVADRAKEPAMHMDTRIGYDEKLGTNRSDGNESCR